jgi:hypothetical protein
VNLAARLEKLVGRLGHSVILSADFAHYAEAPIDVLGDFDVAGSAKQKAFGLRA